MFVFSIYFQGNIDLMVYGVVLEWGLRNKRLGRGHDECYPVASFSHYYICSLNTAILLLAAIMYKIR